MKYDPTRQELFFVGDTHFGHRSMAEHWRVGKYNYGTTLMAGLDRKAAMDEELINQWNAVVPRHGIVFHLGDVSFRNSKETGAIVDRLNGEVHLIPGNHDKGHTNVLRDWGWIIEPQYLEVDINMQRVIMCHYAFRSWNKMHHGAWNIHGHSHGNLAESNGKQLDVGVDSEAITTALRPVSFVEVLMWMEHTAFVPVDHHLPKEGT